MENDTNEILGLLMNYEKEYLITARFHEAQRATVSNLILAVTGALIAVIGFGNEISQTDSMLGVAISLLGSYGVIFTRKSYQKAQVYSALAKDVHQKIVSINPIFSFDSKKSEILENHKETFCIVNRIPIGFLWPILHVFIVILGVFIIFSR